MQRLFRHAYRDALFLVLLAWLLAFLVWPIVLTVAGGFATAQGRFTLRYVVAVFEDPLLGRGLLNSLTLAAGTTALCLVIALPLSLLAARCEFPLKAALSSLILVPLILPPFVGAIGMRALLGRFGALNALLTQAGLLDPDQPGPDWLGGVLGGRMLGIVLMQALSLYPILFLNVSAALANLDPALDEAALGLGASRSRRFFQITFPLILPGLFAGATIVFIWSFTELGTPLMFDFYTVTPVQIYWGIQEVATSPRPYALTVVMLVVAVSLYLLSKLALGGRAYAMHAKASIAAAPRKLTGLAGWLSTLLFAAVIGVAVLPHLGVVLTSLSRPGAWYRSVLPEVFTLVHFRGALGHELAMASIRNSLLYATVAMLVCVAAGLAIAYLNVRAKVRGGWLLDALAMLPLAVPGLVMAFGFVAMSLKWPFAKGGPLEGMFDIVGRNPNPVLLLVIAYSIRRLPYVVRSVSAGLEQTSGVLEEAALNLGASPLYAIRRVVAPLIMANIIAGGILAFSFAMLEVSDSLMLAQKDEHYPITKAIFDLFGRLGDGPYIASAMGVWGMALLTVTLVGAGLLLGKKLGAIFRV